MMDCSLILIYTHHTAHGSFVKGKGQVADWVLFTEAQMKLFPVEVPCGSSQMKSYKSCIQQESKTSGSWVSNTECLKDSHLCGR